MKKILLFLLLISTWASAQVRIGTATETDLYQVVFYPPLTSFNTRTVYIITFNNANTATTVTLDPEGIVEATPITDNGGNAIGVGVIKAGATHTLKFDGTNLRAMDVSSSVTQGENTTWVTKTSNYTPVAADTLENAGFLMTSASAISFTVPGSLTTNFSIGTKISVRNNSTGLLSILKSPSVVIKCLTSEPWTLAEDEYAELSKIDTDTWALVLFKRPILSQETAVALYTEFSTVGNVTGGEDELFSYTLEGGTLSTDGNAIRGRFSGQVANNANVKTVRLSFGAIDIIAVTTTTPTIGQGWVLDYEIVRTSDSTQRTNATFSGGAGIAAASYVAAVEDLTGDVDIVLTGESASAATNDIVKFTATATFAPGEGSGGTVPPPIEPPVIPFVIMDNAVKGNQGYQHEYNNQSLWPENLSMPNWYANTLTYSATTNEFVELKFNGTKIEWYTEVQNTHGIAAVSIDGGAETNVDLYSATSLQQTLVYTSPALTQAEHTIKIRVTGTKNASSSAFNVTHDYLKIYNNLPVTPTPDLDEANRYIATNGVNTGNCSNIASPCLTLAYTVTQSASGDLIQIGPGTFTETSYITVPLNVDIRGSGIDVTILKGSSGLWDDFDDFDYEFDKSLLQYSSGSEANGEQYIRELTIDGTGTAYNDGTGPTHSTLLNDRGMYGGIWINNRNNVTVELVKVRKCFFYGIYISNTEFAKVLSSQFFDNSYGQTAFATGDIMWGKNYNDDMEISGCTVNEGFGNGMKAFAALTGGADQGIVRRFKIHGNSISVVPTGQWSGGSAPNIAFENWGVPMRDCELYDNYIDANISLVQNEQDDDGLNTIRVYNNVIDMLTRSAGANYPIELSISYAEIDHNYIIGGRHGSLINFQAASYPTLSPWYGFWDIHHNSVIATQDGNPTMFIRSDSEGMHQVYAYNNTIEVDNYAGDGNTSHRAWSFFGTILPSLSSANIEAKNNVVWDKSGGTSAPFANRMWYLGTGNTVSSCTISNNQLFSISQNAVSGVTYASNGTADPQMNKTGVKPSPFYIPINGGNLNNTGVDVGLPFLGAAPDLGAFEFD